MKSRLNIKYIGELINLEELLGDVLETSAMACFVLDQHFERLLYANRASFLIFGLDDPQSFQSEAFEVSERDFLGICLKIKLDAFLEGDDLGPVTKKVRFKNAKGIHHHIEVTISKSEKPKGVYYLVHVRLLSLSYGNDTEQPSYSLDPAVRSYLDHSKELIWSVDTNLRLVIFNPAFSTWFEKVLGRKPVEGDLVISPEYPKNMAEEWNNLYQRAFKGEQIDVETQYGHHFFHHSFSPYADDEGNILGVAVFGKNITEEKIYRDALRDSEERFRALADSIPGVVFIVEKASEYGVVYLSDTIEKVTGYHPSEFYNHNAKLSNLIHPRDLEWIFKQQEQSYAEGLPYHIEYRMKGRNGLYRWIEEYGAVVVKKDGKKYLQGVFFDITERKTAENALVQSERNFRMIFENTSEIIFSLDTSMCFTYASPASFKFIGYHPAEMVGEAFLPFIFEEDQQSCLESLEKLMVTKAPQQNIKYRIKHKSGGTRWHICAFNPVLTSENKVLHIVGTSKDIAEIVHAEQAIKEQNKKLKELNDEKDSLLSVVAHDLKSPLDKVRGLAQLVGMAGDLTDDQKSYLALIEQLTQSGGNLISSLLDLSKIEQNITKINVKEEDVGKLVIYAVESHLQKAKKKNITIDVEVPGYYLGAFLDASLVARCVDNLLSNAIKFSGPYTKVVVELKKEGKDHFSISVTDQGPGISEEDKKKMFQKFQKLSAAPTAGESSSGLGLAIVKALVEKMNGEVIVDSILGKGARFTIKLPFSES